MTAPRWRLILNGKSADDEPLREAVQALRARGIELAVRVTWERGDAARHVAEALADGVATVIAAGGDGTLGEVAAALAETDASAAALPSLALVPLGTGNDFATAAGLPDVPLAALELVHARPAHPVDLLRITADDAVHWAANLASGGFGTEATLETRDGLKDVLGGLAYLITGMSRLGRIEPIAARLRGPDFDWQGGFIALGLGNGRQAGGGQALCPDALIDDGLLDLTVIPELEHGMAGALGTVMREGKRAALDRIATRARLPWLRIDAPQAFTLNLDGEPVQAARFDVACVAGRVRMHLPTGCPLLGTPGNPMPVAEAGSAGPDDLPGLVPA